MFLRYAFRRGIILFGAWAFLHSFLFSQWSSDPATNTPVVNLTRDQVNARIIADGTGGSILAWQDFRNSINNVIYVQRLDAAGNALWGAQGVTVSASTADQTASDLVSDGSGGAIVTWQNTISGTTDIYAQHMSGAGAQLWPLGGVALCAAAGEQANPKIVEDGSGGAIVTWVDYRSGTANIYAQRVTFAGVAGWTVNGVLLCGAANDQLNPQIITDEVGGAIVCWEDGRSGTNSDIYAQRVDQAGTPMWTVNGVAVCTVSGHQRNPSMVLDEERGAIITWQDFRSSNWDIYAQRVSSNGLSLWRVNGKPVCDLAQDQLLPKLARDGFGGALIAWEDLRSISDYNIYAQHVASDSSEYWTPDGAAVCTNAGDQTFPALINDGIDGAIVTWQDGRNGNADIYAQRLTAAGSNSWTVDGIAVGSAANDQISPFIAKDRANGAFVVWQDFRSGSSYDVFAQNVNGNGVLGLSAISGIVYSDLNNNGARDAGEPGVSGWKLNLTGSAVLSRTTAANGSYSFGGLLPGLYVVTEVDSNGKGWALTSPVSGSVFVTIDSAGANPADRDFGNFHLATVRGRVYTDANANGVRDGAEGGLASRRVQLRGGATLDTLTDAFGNFVFVGLQEGSYSLRQVVPAGWMQTQPSAPDSYLVAITSGQQIVGQDFGEFQLGSISGKVAVDVLGDSLIAGDPGMTGWTVRLYRSGILQQRLVSGGSGAYSFGGLSPGVYTVEESLFTGWNQTIPLLSSASTTLATFGPGAGPRAYQTTISTTNQRLLNLDFGNFEFGTILGTVYRDITGDSIITGDPPLQGWVVRIYKDRVFHAEMLTDSSGAYSFGSLRNGSYTVEESMLVGWSQMYPKPHKKTNDPSVIDTSYGPGGSPRSHLLPIGASGTYIDGRDFGNFREAAITGTVFYDTNRNAAKDPAENGIAFWQIRLTGPATDITTQTDPGGSYIFPGLANGRYVVHEILQPGWRRSFPAVADSYTVDITRGVMAAGRNFGFYLASSVSGQVFDDLNGNTAKSADEPGIPDWTVLLRSQITGLTIRSTKTDGGGAYTFTDLPLGSYAIVESLQFGFSQTLPVNDLPQPLNLTSIQQVTGIRFGVFRLATIAGMKFQDIDGDSVRDFFESPVANWQITIKRYGEDSVLASTTTDGSGNYSFPYLRAGLYVVGEKGKFGELQTIPGGPEYTHLIPISLSGQLFPTVDFGDFTWGVITGRVFHDQNGNGLRGAAEPGLGGWRVFLRSSDDNIRDTTTTSDNGVYQFSGIPQRTYVVSQEQRTGWYQIAPPTGGFPVTVDSAGKTFPGGDFANFTAGISGVVFNDLNGDGALSASKPRLAGWQINLKEFGTGTILKTSVTDSIGRYSFIGVAPGTYTVAQQLLAGWTQTLPVPVTSYTISVATSNSFFADRNFGNFSLFTVSGVSFEDLNSNGIQDVGELPQTSWKVYLQKAGSPPDSVVTTGSGSFSFAGLKPGTYTVSEEIKNGWQRTGPSHPGSYGFSAVSGASLTSEHFANHLILPNSILVRKLKDLDGSFATHTDNVMKPWSLNLYKSTGGGDSLITTGLNRSASSLLATGLLPGTYIVRGADSISWQSIGKIRNGIPLQGSYNADTVTLTASGSHSIDLVAALPNQVTLRSFGDADAIFGTTGDRANASWMLSLYARFISPENLIGSVASAESLVFPNLGEGTFVAVEADSFGWNHIGTVLTGSASAGTSNFRSFTLSGGRSATVDFINAKVGNVSIRSYADADGNMGTTGDRTSKRWNLRLYRDVISPGTLVSATSAESLVVSGLATGNYIAFEADSLAWTHIGTQADGFDSTGAHAAIDLTVGQGESHAVNFYNFGRPRKVTWTGAVNCEWGNASNWFPAIVPRSIDSVVITSKSVGCSPAVPPNSVFAGFTVEDGGQLALSSVGTMGVLGEMRMAGVVMIAPAATPTFTITGDYIAGGDVDPGHSTFIFGADSQQTLSGGIFYNVKIGSDSSATPSEIVHARVRSSTDLEVRGTLTLNQNLDAGGRKLFVLSPDPSAVGGQGSLTRGTMRRMVDAGAGIPYRFGSPGTSLLFRHGPAGPFGVGVTVYPETSAMSFGQYWRSEGGLSDTLSRLVVVDSISSFPELTPWTFGVQEADSSVPRVRRVYDIVSDIDTGLIVQLSLQYETSEVLPGTDPGALSLLQKRFSKAKGFLAGWNLVSLPVQIPDTRISTLFPSVGKNAFTYDAARHRYLQTDSLGLGLGYWVKLGSNQTLDLLGELKARDTIPVSQGWNLVGSLSVPVPTSSITSDPPNNIRSAFYGFNNGYSASLNLQPFGGYWVKVTQDGYLIMNSGASQMLANRATAGMEPPELASMNILRIGEGGESGQTLYFGKGETSDQIRYELPPPSPGGGFDARFTSGSQAAFVKTNEVKEFPIAVSEEVRTLSIVWEIKDPSQHAVLRIGSNAVQLTGKGEMGVANNGARIALVLGAPEGLPKSYALEQNYPNPFNPSTTIRFDLPTASHVVLRIYNILGQEVVTLIDAVVAGGRNSLAWDGAGIPSGVYFYRLEATSVADPATRFSGMKKMLLVK